MCLCCASHNLLAHPNGPPHVVTSRRYFIFTSFWNYKVYYVYGLLLLVFAILLIVTLCVTVVGTYFLLNAENYHWPWTAFGMAASTGAYVALYSVHYFVFKTRMTGLLQVRKDAQDTRKGARAGTGEGTGVVEVSHERAFWRGQLLAPFTTARPVGDVPIALWHFQAKLRRAHHCTVCCLLRLLLLPRARCRVCSMHQRSRQTAFYYGYTAMLCCGLSLMCGSVGYWGAAAFVRTIYRNVKCD